MPESTGRAARRDQLRELMDQLGLDALLLRRHANFAWYTGGADSRVDHASPLGLADIVVTREAEYVLTSNIEAPRLREEETPDIEVVEYPWYEGADPILRSMVGTRRLGADVAVAGAHDASTAVSPLRYVLDADAIERYRIVGIDAVAAMEETADVVRPGMREEEAAAQLAAACRRRDLFAPVILVAGDDRIARYRHAIPHRGRITRRVMLVVCAERGGLYANFTRFVHLESPDAELRSRFEASETILRRMREATRSGRTLGAVFDDCRRFYAEAGFPEEWKLHHQGGITGYASRELMATPGSNQKVQVGQAFAWNPSITGTKAEETIILTAAGPEVIAAAPSG